MDSKNISTKKTLIIIVVVLVLAGSIYLLVKGDKDSNEDILKNAQGTLEEQGGEESEISFEGTMSQGEVVDVEFRFRDYKDVPDDPETLQETEDALIPVEGSVSFEIIKTGRTDQADSFHQAGEGKELYYVIYNFKGDSDNPKGSTIRPSSISQTGWDPAPQFVMIEDGEDDYASSSYRRPLLQSLDYDASLSGPDFTEEEVCAAVWEVEEGSTPEIALKYIDMDGEAHYIEFKD